MNKTKKLFLGAMGSILDIVPSTNYLTIARGNLSDHENFRSDCEYIAADFRKVLEEYNVEAQGHRARARNAKSPARAR